MVLKFCFLHIHTHTSTKMSILLRMDYYTVQQSLRLEQASWSLSPVQQNSMVSLASAPNGTLSIMQQCSTHSSDLVISLNDNKLWFTSSCFGDHAPRVHSFFQKRHTCHLQMVWLFGSTVWPQVQDAVAQPPPVGAYGFAGSTGSDDKFAAATFLFTAR